MHAEDERADWSREPRAEPGSMADQWIDELLPEDFDWRETVRSHPISALAVAAVGGFFLARRHGSELLGAFDGFVDREVSKNIRSFLGD